MIKAQLSHNPYVMETKVLFNNRAPRINSLVEKYQEGDLHTWIKKIPSIFHDEMNGYDFELEFSGTELDFEELKKAFIEAGFTVKTEHPLQKNELDTGVTKKKVCLIYKDEMDARVADNEVHLFHKNELDSREKKQESITTLLNWLATNPNDIFDYASFREENRELFEGTFPFIIVEKRPLDASIFDGTDVEAEHISGYQEVESTDLCNTPIIFYISEENQKEFQNDLKTLMARPDVIPAQLFFIAHSSIDEEKAKRVVSDLGIENPQFISSLSDSSIKKYLDIYPRSEYINQAIKAFRAKTDAISEILAEENRISEQENRVIKRQIESLGQTISNLKKSLNDFIDRDNIDIPSTWTVLQQNFLYDIKRWNNRRTKMTSSSEAEQVASEFESELQRLYRNYLSSLNAEVISSKEELRKTYATWYANSEYGDSFETTVNSVSIGLPDMVDLPSIHDDFLQLKEEKWVQPKEDLFGMFFKSSTTEEKEPVLETTYYYQAWRDHAATVVMPIAEEVLQAYYALIQAYEDNVANLYINHLEMLVSEKTQEKEEVSSTLSEDAQKLQSNNNWLSAFVEQLQVIERR